MRQNAMCGFGLILMKTLCEWCDVCLSRNQKSCQIGQMKKGAEGIRDYTRSGEEQQEANSSWKGQKEKVELSGGGSDYCQRSSAGGWEGNTKISQCWSWSTSEIQSAGLPLFASGLSAFSVSLTPTAPIRSFCGLQSLSCQCARLCRRSSAASARWVFSLGQSQLSASCNAWPELRGPAGEISVQICAPVNPWSPAQRGHHGIFQSFPRQHLLLTSAECTSSIFTLFKPLILSHHLHTLLASGLATYIINKRDVSGESQELLPKTVSLPPVTVEEAVFMLRLILHPDCGSHLLLPLWGLHSGVHVLLKASFCWPLNMLRDRQQ